MRFVLFLLFGSVLFATESEIGLTANQTPIRCDYGPGSLDYKRVRVVILGGLDGTESPAVAKMRGYNSKYALITVPLANSDNAQMQFPPSGEAYKNQPESHYLWRWLRVL